MNLQSLPKPEFASETFDARRLRMNARYEELTGVYPAASSAEDDLIRLIAYEADLTQGNLNDEGRQNLLGLTPVLRSDFSKEDWRKATDTLPISEVARESHQFKGNPARLLHEIPEGLFERAGSYGLMEDITKFQVRQRTPANWSDEIEAIRQTSRIPSDSLRHINKNEYRSSDAGFADDALSALQNPENVYYGIAPTDREFTYYFTKALRQDKLLVVAYRDGIRTWWPIYRSKFEKTRVMKYGFQVLR